MMGPVFIFVLVNVVFNKYVNGFFDVTNLTHNNAFDLELYKNVLDPVLCQEQLDYLRWNNSFLLTRFMDAGIRTPRGILLGHFSDMGNYYPCLNIKHQIPDSVIEGKYCSINFPLNFWPLLSTLAGSTDFSERNAIANMFPLDKELTYRLQKLKGMQQGLERTAVIESFQGLSFNLAICLPKVCTTKEAVNGLLPNELPIDFSFDDNFCRLPNDKPWVAVDYVAASIFSLIGLLSILSTGYDVYHSVLRKRDPKLANSWCLTFSVFTNTRRLVTYNPVPGTLECMDGIRVLAMAWVIMGHTFVYELNDFLANPVNAYEWIVSWQSIWITTAPITVDTFFTLGGMLVVYTTAGKLTGLKLLKNLHLFYLNRVLRMLPILATFVLIEASFLNRVSDGPNWNTVASGVHNCRANWWSTLLFVHNLVTPRNMCLGHTWYLAIDVQMYIISPLVLFWILSGKKLYSWAALIAAVSCTVIASSIYNIINQFPSAPVRLTRPEEQDTYMFDYYVFTLTRSPPFFVGMVFGYLLHLYRNEKIVLPKIHVTILWLCAIGIMGGVTYSTYPVVQADWDNQTADTLINSLMRPGWALAIGWFVFACVQGYGGPVNWFLSLQMWKIPSRLSYAMYIVHFPMLFAVKSTTVSPVFFTVEFTMMKFLNDLVLAVVVSFIVVVLIDAPCSILIKQLMGPGPKRPQGKALPSDIPTVLPVQGTVNGEYANESAKSELK